MEWAKFPDAVQARVLLAAVTVSSDVAGLRSLERRASHLAPATAWARAAAHAQLGIGICAALTFSAAAEPLEDKGACGGVGGGAGPDWSRVLRNATAGRLRCASPPLGLASDARQGDRSGHAAALVRGTCLVVFSGVQAEQLQTPPQEASSPIMPLAAVDLERGCWVEIFECGGEDPASIPSRPRVRPTLTARGFSGATLVGGQTAAGRVFGDLWSLRCEMVSQGAGSRMQCSWQEVATRGLGFPARSCHTAVATPCGLLVVGGVGLDGHVLPCEAYCLDFDHAGARAAWRLPEQSGLFPPQGALHHGCHYRDHLVLVGGVDDAGLQRRGLGRATDVHLLNLNTWVWERLGRHPLTPPLHSRAAPVLFGDCLLLVGGDSGASSGQTSDVAVLNLERTVAPRPSCCGRGAVWSTGVVVGLTFGAAGHSALGGVLLGGLGRSDPAAPVALLLPDAAPPAPKAKARQVPRWFKS